MRFLVIGLGSMGKRRIRNLLRIDPSYTIIGLDNRTDRCEEVEEKYAVNCINSLEEIDDFNLVDAVIISVPPDQHMHYAHYAFRYKKPCFIEASVVSDGIQDLIDLNSDNQVVMYPSCTLRFHPSVKLIKNLIDQGAIGKVANFSYHSGQYLPDWHPWEDIRDFYVSNPLTGGCREIVPFELAWLNWVFGDLKEIFGFNEQTINMGIELDDTYASVLRYKSGVIGTLIVDVVARQAIRKLIINGDQGQIIWDWDEKQLRYYDAKSARWVIYKEPSGSAEVGYNGNIIEEMYIDEVKHFISAFMGKEELINTLSDDIKILDNLYAIERANEVSMSQKF